MTKPVDIAPRRGPLDNFRKAAFMRFSPRLYWLLRRLVCLVAPLVDSFRSGQLRSAVTGKVVNRRGEPLPWLTYPAIDFLGTLALHDKRVLEFGSGYSTLWWAKRAESVISFEADQRWMNSLTMPSNATVIPLATDPNDRFHRTVGVEKFLKETLGDQRFDVIVIDGVDRVGTARASLPYLAEGGIVVVDNSDSHMLGDGTMPILEVYREAGLRRVDFYGLGPSILFPQCTSIAFREGAFAFDGRQDTLWLKPFERKSYGNPDVEFNTGFIAVADAADATP